MFQEDRRDMKNTKPNVADAENTHQEKGLNIENEKFLYKNKRSYDHLHDFIPCGWYLFVIMTIWVYWNKPLQKFPCLFRLSACSFRSSAPIAYLQKKVWLKNTWRIIKFRGISGGI
ncbi:hypothetical protein PO124_30490 [Bacillus licheniformis]|nr:hypothetical protein [Bacillus licheniformis]